MRGILPPYFHLICLWALQPQKASILFPPCPLGPACRKLNLAPLPYNLPSFCSPRCLPTLLAPQGSVSFLRPDPCSLLSGTANPGASAGILSLCRPLAGWLPPSFPVLRARRS